MTILFSRVDKDAVRYTIPNIDLDFFQYSFSNIFMPRSKIPMI